MRASTDVIFLTGLTTDCIIGIWDWERRVKQKVVVDLEMAADIAAAPATDSIADTIEYKKVARDACCSSSASTLRFKNRHDR